MTRRILRASRKEISFRAVTLNEMVYVCDRNRVFNDSTIDTWLEDFVSEFCDDIRDEIRIGVGEKGHGRHQRSAVIIYHIL